MIEFLATFLGIWLMACASFGIWMLLAACTNEATASVLIVLSVVFTILAIA